MDQGVYNKKIIALKHRSDRSFYSPQEGGIVNPDYIVRKISEGFGVRIVEQFEDHQNDVSLHVLSKIYILLIEQVVKEWPIEKVEQCIMEIALAKIRHQKESLQAENQQSDP